MSQTEIPYEELKKEVIEVIEERQLKILASSDGDFVAAREVRFISDGLTMFFFTDSRSRKCDQLKANPNVAVAVGNLQIEGTASIQGHPLEAKNSKYFEIFERKQPEWYEWWKNSGNFEEPNGLVVEVVPKRISMYKTRAFDKVPNLTIFCLMWIRKKDTE